jgi:hypothetical protein
MCTCDRESRNFFCQTEIDEVDLVTLGVEAHEEVVGFDVSVDEVLRMHVFDASDHLVGNHENGLDG